MKAGRTVHAIGAGLSVESAFIISVTPVTYALKFRVNRSSQVLETVAGNYIISS